MTIVNYKKETTLKDAASFHLLLLFTYKIKYAVTKPDNSFRIMQHPSLRINMVL